MNDARAILIANGTIENKIWLAQYLQPKDMIICADGGYNHLAAIGRLPHLIIGDMDSVSAQYCEQCKQLVHPRRKDETDAQLALDYLAEQGYREVHFLGALGGNRPEHALANVFMLQYAAERGVRMTIETDASTISLHQGPETAFFHGSEGDYLSLIPLDGDVTGITTDNLEYPLRDGCLKFGVPMGISNVLLKDVCSVKLSKGKLLAVLTKADGVDET